MFVDYTWDCVYRYAKFDVASVELIETLVGWLLIRAANDPRKTTFLFVLLVLEVISGVYTLIQTASQGASASAPGAGAILSLAISVLALFVTYKARSQ